MKRQMKEQTDKREKTLSEMENQFDQLPELINDVIETEMQFHIMEYVFRIADSSFTIFKSLTHDISEILRNTILPLKNKL